VDAALLATWKVADGVVPLANPLSSELGAMRTALLPGLVEALKRNRARQQERVRLFELGRVFHAAAGDGENAANAAPRETPRIAAVACGPASAERWSGKSADVDFYDIKAEVEALLALAAATKVEFRTDSETPFAHPGRSASVWRDGVRIGWVGHLHPRLLKALDIEGEVVAFELDADALARREVARASELSRFPSLRRDLAVVVPEGVAWDALRSSLETALTHRLRDVVVFDQYHGPGLEKGSRSIAMGLILQEVSRTLTDADADQAVADALAALSRDCQATLRT
jgi:phenylalanyl-tRNA synthetase beta chain